MDWSLIISSGISGLIGAGSGLIIGIMKQRNDSVLASQKQKSVSDLATQKQESDIKLSETDKAFCIYKEVVADLRQQMDGVFKGVHDLEAQVIALREEKAVITGKLDVALATIEIMNKQRGAT